MRQRFGSFLLALALTLAAGLGVGLPVGVFAATTYATCPTFSQFQSDVQSISGTGTITFGAAHCSLMATSTITTQDNSDVTISGNGLTLSGGTAASPGSFNLIEAGTGAGLTLDNVILTYGYNGISQSGRTGSINLSSSTIQDNAYKGIYQFGGTLHVSNSVISGNGDEGISRSTDTVVVTNSTISGNGSDGIIQSSGSITVTGSTIRNNYDGGVSSTSGAINVTNSTLSGNYAGISQNSGTVNVTNSTLSDNSFGGIQKTDGAVTVSNSTVSGNGSNGLGLTSGAIKATNSTISGNGSAGILINSGDISVTNDTIVGNGGKGIHVIGSSTPTLTATVLASNSAGNCDSPIVDQGYNLSDDASCAFTATGSQSNVSDAALNLGTLGYHGGPNPTIPLLSGSVAIDAVPTGTKDGLTVCLDAHGQPIVDPTSNQPIVTDERGVTRPQILACDVGAYEASVPASSPRASLTILNLRRPLVQSFVVVDAGGNISGGFSYQDNVVSLSQVHVQSLVENGREATLYGTAALADGTPVNFVLSVSQGSFGGQIRLQLSNGYDSGWESVMIVKTGSATTRFRRF